MQIKQIQCELEIVTMKYFGKCWLEVLSIDKGNIQKIMNQRIANPKAKPKPKLGLGGFIFTFELR